MSESSELSFKEASLIVILHQLRSEFVEHIHVFLFLSQQPERQLNLSEYLLLLFI